MDDRISSDHSTVETVTGTVGRFGGTTRPAIELPESTALVDGDCVRIVLDETEYHTVIRARAGGVTLITSVARTPRQARERSDRTDHLGTWLQDHDLSVGRSVLVDVVEPKFRYGLRAPGESTTYPSRSPDDGLSAIANQYELE